MQRNVLKSIGYPHGGELVRQMQNNKILRVYSFFRAVLLRN